MLCAPFEGRLAEPTENNQRAAKIRTLTISLLWIKDKKLDEDVNCHPVTELSGTVNTQTAECLGYVCNPHSLNEGTEALHQLTPRGLTWESNHL
ncbi:50S ribosomal protein L18 [Labeo rohita]|uniref:50S ribosomal protein L18 n=1 Tax=Labeo rohita TaxID=84645 RepID=A0ABQ8ME45_LABRO|nr:50S ribosomal protein L18 [Labeo rohita]